MRGDTEALAAMIKSSLRELPSTTFETRRMAYPRDVAFALDDNGHVCIYMGKDLMNEMIMHRALLAEAKERPVE